MPTGRKALIFSLLCLTAASLGTHALAEENTASPVRWISGSAVNLRVQPSVAAGVVTRMALNARVDLIGRVPQSPYCEISTTLPGGKSARGFAACEFLSPQPFDAQRMHAWQADGTPNPDYDPVKAFSIAPSWERLAMYADFLHRTKLTDEERAHPPSGVYKDPALERMKEHLGKPNYGPTPSPFADWADLKRDAAAATRRPVRPNASDVANRSDDVTRRLGAWGVEFADERPEVIVHLVNAIELPLARPSLFTSEGDIAPPHESATALSGRFRISHIWRIRPRGLVGDDAYEGLWDIRNATASLVVPVVTATLHRNGRVHSARSRAPKTVPLRSQSVDGPMCEGYEDGFAFGDADTALWRYLYPELNQEILKALPKRSPGSLLRVHLRNAPPHAMARTSISRQALDRQSTGFTRAMSMQFDLDHDGELDLVVWEGVGHGPGHLGGRTATDDAWLRLFFVNIAGRWKVLGSDSFGYGCGC